MSAFRAPRFGKLAAIKQTSIKKPRKFLFPRLTFFEKRPVLKAPPGPTVPCFFVISLVCKDSGGEKAF